MSPLPSITHALVKHALVTTLSSSSLFSEDVILESLTQVKEDSHLKLLKNLSSNRGGKQMALSASFSGQQWGSHASFWFSSSSSWLQLCVFFFFCFIAFERLEGRLQWHPAFAPKAASFSQSCPSPLRVGGCLSLHWTIWRDGSRAVGGRGVEEGISPSLLITTSSLSGSDSPAKLLLFFHHGDSSPWGGFGSSCQGSSRACSPFSWFVQPSICGMEDLGVMEAVIDLSRLNEFAPQPRFKMESSLSVLSSI